MRRRAAKNARALGGIIRPRERGRRDRSKQRQRAAGGRPFQEVLLLVGPVLGEHEERSARDPARRPVSLGLRRRQPRCVSVKQVPHGTVMLALVGLEIEMKHHDGPTVSLSRCELPFHQRANAIEEILLAGSARSPSAPPHARPRCEGAIHSAAHTRCPARSRREGRSPGRDRCDRANVRPRDRRCAHAAESRLRQQVRRRRLQAACARPRRRSTAARRCEGSQPIPGRSTTKSDSDDTRSTPTGVV